MGVPMPSATARAEVRKALKVTVDLSSVDVRLPAREGITENVSAHGARVVLSHELPRDLPLNVRSMLGSLRSRARVVYCERMENGLFAVGLELFATFGDWVIPGTLPAMSGELA
jgi:PilZ domain-containing protein